MNLVVSQSRPGICIEKGNWRNASKHLTRSEGLEIDPRL